MEIAAGKFKAICLKLMEKVKETHEEIIITKKGVPIAKLIHMDSSQKKNIFGLLKNTVSMKDNLISPIDTKWNAE